jgi:chromate transporter
LPPHEPHNLPLGDVRFATGYGALACIALFLLLLGLSSYGFGWGGDIALFSAFFRTGALVFGGGHVVLPLLQTEVVLPGWVSPPVFLAGYGAAQAMPGPLFTIAAFLGAVASVGPGGAAGAVIALVAIFLPGVLLVAGLLPYWNNLRRNAALAGTIAGVNAAVVGLLAYALLNLVALGSVRSLTDVAITVLAFLALSFRRMPPIIVVVCCAGAGVLV